MQLSIIYYFEAAWCKSCIGKTQGSRSFWDTIHTICLFLAVVLIFELSYLFKLLWIAEKGNNGLFQSVARKRLLYIRKICYPTTTLGGEMLHSYTGHGHTIWFPLDLPEWHTEIKLPFSSFKCACTRQSSSWDITLLSLLWSAARSREQEERRRESVSRG